LRGARERISRILLEIYVRVRRRLPAEPGEILPVPLSQAHIGQALGLTYVHVCRTLQILREQRIIRFANQRLEIINPSALVAAAGIEVDALVSEHRARLCELARIYEGNAADPLPMGWMPIQNNAPSRVPFVPRAKAA
jgi:Crp-like helix-turn-helix domain